MLKYLKLLGFGYPSTVGYQILLDKKTCLVVQYFAEDWLGIALELYHGISHHFLQVLLHIGVHLDQSITMMVQFVQSILMTHVMQLVGVLNQIQMKNTFMGKYNNIGKEIKINISLFCFVCKYVAWILEKCQKENYSNGIPHYFCFVFSAHFYSCDTSYFVF